MEYRNAVFIVTEEHVCPLYNVGEEFVVQDSTLTVESDRPVCLLLVQELLQALSGSKSFVRQFTQTGMQRAKFECGGCSGLIRFEYKKEKAFSTLQMNLLKVAQQRAKMRHLEVFFDLLRGMELFEPLEDPDLRDLAAMLKLRRYGAHKVLIAEGDRGTHLYIVLSGKVAVVKDNNDVIAEMGAGEIFGEMSLLSGEPAYPSVHSRTEVQVATLNAKDFKHVLNKYPILQIFFYRILVNRAQVNSLRSGKISSGMSGELADINAVELFQLINSGGKTGTVEFVFFDGRATVLFNEGEIVQAEYAGNVGKEAVFLLLAKQKGTFTYTTGLSKEEKELEVLGGFMGLIMEGIHRIDEEAEEKD
jgi:CRP-like cAMP-binding protein